MSQNPTQRPAAGTPAPGEALIGPPHEPASGAPIPVTVAVPRRTHRRPGAHTPPGGDARPVTLGGVRLWSLRRSVISVLVIVTLWLLALGVFTAIGRPAARALAGDGRRRHRPRAA